MKKKSYNKVGILLMFVVLFACQGNAGRKTADDSAQSPRQEQAVEPQFPFPSIPSTLTEPEERKEYLLQHYWDNFDFSDSALVNNRLCKSNRIVGRRNNRTGTHPAEHG